MKYPVDNPIIKEEDDLLGRKNLAELFVKTLRSIDATKGAVVSVMGAWGSGKTSFINLVKQELEETSTIPVIEFNPWMFSGSEQLPEIFFHEIAVELKLMNNSKFDKVSDAISEYSDALSILAYVPYVGKWLDRSIRTYKSLHKLKKEKGAKQLRKKLRIALKSLNIQF
jgi:KAP family P-loop domain protein